MYNRYLRSHLIDSCVRRCANKDWAAVLLDQLVDNSGRCDGFTGPWRTLDQRQRPLEGMPHSVHLRLVQFGQVRSRELTGQMTLEKHVLHIVAQESDS